MKMKWIFLLGMAATLFLSSCGVWDAIWGSIKDRYKPYEFIGMEGDKVMVKFVFDSPSSTEVWLAGTFNGWAATKSAPRYPDVPLDSGVLVPMKIDPTTGYWVATLPLAAGRYQYKMVLDAGRVWAPDMNTDLVDDNYGGKNSIIVVIAK